MKRIFDIFKGPHTARHAFHIISKQQEVFLYVTLCNFLSALLLVQESQKEVLDYIKQSCKDFQAFADQCATYIDLYGPLVLNMAKQYLKPELCTQLGFCKAADRAEAVSAA